MNDGELRNLLTREIRMAVPSVERSGMPGLRVTRIKHYRAIHEG